MVDVEEELKKVKWRNGWKSNEGLKKGKLRKSCRLRTKRVF